MMHYDQIPRRRLILHRVVVYSFCVLMASACAPITPLPTGGPSLPVPTAGGLPGGTPGPSVPGGGNMPSPSPGQGEASGGSDGSGQAEGGQSGGSTGGGMPSGSGSMPGGSGGLPGGSGPGPDGQDGAESIPTWEPTPAGSGEGDWQTSNQLPGGGGSAGGDGEQSPGGAGGSLPSQSPGDAELEGALEDFDGEILAERTIIKESADANPGGLGPDLPNQGGTGQGDSEQGGALSGPVRREVPPSPAPPRRGAESVPDDIPDARDDDIIARQLREAAMQEDDPVLKEKLWEEYRKYKKG